MRKIIYLMMILLNVGSIQAKLNGEGSRMKNNARSIEQHLKEDSRLIGANKEIGFIQAFENEVVDEKKVVSYPDISTNLLTLTPQLIFKVAKTQASRKIIDSGKQEVGEYHRFKFVDVLDENKFLTLEVSEYATQVGYYYARDNFLGAVRLTSMMFIPFKKSSANLGIVSVELTKNDTIIQMAWIYRNVYFYMISRNMSEEDTLKILYWAQEQVKHPNQ